MENLSMFDFMDDGDQFKPIKSTDWKWSMADDYPKEKNGLKVFSCFACGEGHLSEVLKSHGYKVRSSDIVNRGYIGTETLDFLEVKKEDIKQDVSRDIITNPPYKYAKEFVEHALDISMDSTKVAMFLKVQFLEGKARKSLFEKYPPKTVYISSSRLLCAKNGDFQKMRDGGGSAVAYAWFIWEKGFKGDTVVRWFN